MSSADLIELFMTALRERGCTDATISSYTRYLNHADRTMPYGLDRANRLECHSYIYRPNLGKRTRRTYAAAMRSFYAWAADVAGVLKSNPMANIAPPSAPEGLPRVARNDQAQWVITEAAEPFRLWGTLAAYGNLRCVEVARLHREHISEDAITVHLGKGDKPRIVPTHPLVWAAVRDLPPGPVTELDAGQVSIKFWKYCASRCPGLSMHRLRGWYATQGFRATKDLLAVQRTMGHADPRTTAGYIDLPAEDAVAVIEGLPTFGLCGAEPPGPDSVPPR